MIRNIILYGPPGTGKTYKTKELALDLLENSDKCDPEKIITKILTTKERDKITETFNEELNTSIKMISFHQSFSYEDFVEGRTFGKENKIEYTDGVLKDFIDVKTFDENDKKVFFKEWLTRLKTSEEKSITFPYNLDCSSTRKYYKVIKIDYSYNNGRFREFNGIDNLTKVRFFLDDKKDEDGTTFDYSNPANGFTPGGKGRKALVYRVLKEAGIIYKDKDGDQEKIAIGGMLDKKTKEDILSYVKKKSTASGGDSLTVYYKTSNNSDYFTTSPTDDTNRYFFQRLRDDFLKKNNHKVIEEPLDIYGEISNYLLVDYQNKKEGDKNPKKESTKTNKILIIDEINRGNISAIFGEIISLLGQGEKELKKITLSSKHEFSLPDNLYIIGTMNTADRSAEQMDAAMRRRFEFVELVPKPELLKDKEGKPLEIKGIEIQKVLQTINNRIKVLIGKDYCIGHAYFMELNKSKNQLEELKKKMFNQIIPLLEQYFYNDIEKIGMVLSEDFLVPKADIKLDTIFKNKGDLVEEDIPRSLRTIEFFDETDNQEQKFINAMKNIIVI